MKFQKYMYNKKTLYFVSKCLTLSLEHKNRDEIEQQLKSKSVDWEDIVKFSTAHFVFPALYCNLKKVRLLKYLPGDLVNYMDHISSLNRQRNTKILLQAREINDLLLKGNISFIFLKGTGNLLADIYDDIAERMVGDIDFIISKQDYSKAITILRNFGYSDVHKNKYHLPNKKHYRRLKKENTIAAIEIHKELSGINKFSDKFNFKYVKNDSQVINEFRLLSYANKLNLSIISYQIDDHGFKYRNIALRNAYDVFLLSKKTNAISAIKKLDKLYHPLNCFLSVCHEIFNRTKSLEYIKNSKTNSYLNDFNSQFVNIKKTRIKNKLIKAFLLWKYRINIIFNSLINKEYRDWSFEKLSSLDFYKKIFGLK